ncbi:glycosyltransferase family 2 protein [Candidatus Uhrbacteria bacterium]|nr:glycosyltransferase family 2 protein [Candidatus Uhrbacteria bacterium]
MTTSTAHAATPAAPWTIPRTESSPFDVVAVTVNYQTREEVLTMLQSLYRDIAGSGLRVQPVVVDNASGDAVARAVAAQFRGMTPEPVVLHAPENLGFGRGNNLALRQFAARYYFLVNPDLRFLPESTGTIARLHAFMEERSEIGVVAPRLQRPDGSLQPSCMRFPSFFDQPLHRLNLHQRYPWARRRVERLHMVDVDHTQTRPVDWATGAALFVRADALRDAGHFDERYFMYFEDCDLCRTCWVRGWPVYYKGDVVVAHGHARASAAVSGLRSLLVNPLTRAHLRSLLQYTWKWRGSRVGCS